MSHFRRKETRDREKKRSQKPKHSLEISLYLVSGEGALAAALHLDVVYLDHHSSCDAGEQDVVATRVELYTTTLCAENRESG